MTEEVGYDRKKKIQKEDLFEKYTAKILYRQNNSKFRKEYIRKLERNWQKQKSVSLEIKS